MTALTAQLSQAWDKIAEVDRLKLIKILSKLGSQLDTLPFSAYGSMLDFERFGADFAGPIFGFQGLVLCGFRMRPRLKR